MLSSEERSFVMRHRVARLGTVDSVPAPLVVPVCYALDGDRIFIVIDEKPKSGDFRSLKRLRNIADNDRVCLTVDHYEDDWSHLGWVMIRGRATIADSGAAFPTALELLRERYLGYRTMTLEDRPLIVIAIERVTSWGELDR